MREMNKKEQIETTLETHRYLLRRAELLLIVVVLGGPYEATTFFQAVLIGGWGHLVPLLSIRYLALTPGLLMLIAYLRSSQPNSRKDNKLTVALLIGMPMIALVAVAAVWEDQAIVCPTMEVPALPGA